MVQQRDPTEAEKQVARDIGQVLEKHNLGHDMAASILISMASGMGIKFPCCTYAIGQALMQTGLSLMARAHQAATGAPLGSQATH